MAKKANLNVSVGVDTEAYRSGWDEVIKLTKGAGKETEKEAQKMVNALEKKFEKLTMKQQIRQMENLAAKMEQVGASGTKAFSDVINKTATLKAQQQDLKDLIEASRPDAPFKALGNALQVGAQGFAGIQGAMQLFGAESEEAQKAMVKLQAALALVEGTKAIDGLSDAFTQLNLVIKANPLAAAATAAAGVMAVIVSLSKETETLTAQQQALNEISKEATEIASKEYGKFYSLVSVLQDTSQSTQERKNALSELQKIYPEYLKNLTVENSTTDEGRKIIEATTRALIAQANVKAAMAKLEKIGAGRFEIEQRQQQLQADKAKSFGQQQAYEEREAFKVREEILARQMADIEAQTKAVTDFINKENAKIQKAIISPTEAPTKTKPVEADKPNKLGTVSNFTQVNPQGIKSVDTLSTALEKSAKNIEWNEKAWRDFNKEIANAEGLQKAQSEIEQLNQALEANIEASISGMIEELASGTDPITAVMLQAVSLLSQMGKLMIAQGVAIAAFQKSWDPATKIAAGVAAVAAAALIKSNIQKQESVSKFASGGMVNSPTFAMIGDNLNAHNNPEFVLRRDQLTKIYSGGGNNMQLSARISGNDLLILLDQSRQNRNRG